MEDQQEDQIALKNRLAGIGAEVGGGVATDWLTSGLLASGPWGWVGYGAINFGQGAYTNYLVQKHLYGEDDIKWGEVWASGGMSMIPFSQIPVGAKAAKYLGAEGTVKRGLVGGATMGLAGEQLRVGIDEQRFLNPLEAGAAAGIGGGLGGGLAQISKNISHPPLKVYASELDPTGATDDLMRQQAGLKMRLLNSIDPESQPTISQRSEDFAYSVYKRSNRGLLKQLKDQGVLQEAEDIVLKLDDFKQSKGASQGYTDKFNPDRPTTGFKGPRTVKYTDNSGNPSEVAFRWSITNDTYVPYDLTRRNETILRRLRWNVNRSKKAKWYSDRVYKISKANNTVLRRLLRELRAEDPVRYFEIMGDTRKYATNKGFIFVEHIHAQNSPFWKYTNPKFKPRDTQNLMIVKNEEFGKLKTSIENEIYNNKNFKFPEGKRLLLDYDKKRDVLVLKQLQDNGRLKWVGDISPITNPNNWKKALNAALRGHKIVQGKMGEIQQVIQAETDIPKHVDMIDKITDWKKQDPYE